MSFQNIYVGKTPAVPYVCSRNAAGPIKGTLSTRKRSKFYEQWLTRKASEHDDMSRDGDFQCSFSRSLIRFLLRVLQLKFYSDRNTRIYVFVTFDILCRRCLEHVPCSYEMDHVITLPLHLCTLKL